MNIPVFNQFFSLIGAIGNCNFFASGYIPHHTPTVLNLALPKYISLTIAAPFSEKLKLTITPENIKDTRLSSSCQSPIKEYQELNVAHRFEMLRMIFKMMRNILSAESFIWITVSFHYSFLRHEL